VQILSFSFDPAETDQGLAAFQKLNAGEPNWKVVRATPDQIQQLLDALDFRTLQVGQSNYEHANLVFIANGDRVLRDYVFGADLTPERLQRSIQIAEGRRTGSKSNLLVFAVIGLLVCTFIVVSLWTKNKTQNL
jgi:cytochrome oxidase Cu insertion factor (SCO1/SenC/PrrC family)